MKSMTSHIQSVSLLLIAMTGSPGLSQVPSKSFELRTIPENTEANSETDFKGESEFLNLEERLQFLQQYAAYAKSFFNDTGLNTKVVEEQEVRDFLKHKLKAQPGPDLGSFRGRFRQSIAPHGAGLLRLKAVE